MKRRFPALWTAAAWLALLPIAYLAVDSIRTPESSGEMLLGWLCLALVLGAAPVHFMMVRQMMMRLDIAERLERQNERLRWLATLVDAAADAVIGAEAEGLIKSWNRGAERLFGFRADQVIGKSWVGLVPPSLRPQAAEMRRRAMSGEHVSYESTWLRKDGSTVEVWISVSPVLESDGRVASVVVVARDVSERHRLDRIVQAKSHELERSNKELESYAYVASHDLQEPARKMASFAQLLRERYAGQLDAEGRRLLFVISDAARRMQSMIQDLLAYSRVTTRGAAFEKTSVRRALSDALADLEGPIRESNASISHDPLPDVVADPVQLEQVLLNLLSNAIKFRKNEPPRLRLSVRPAGGRAYFSLSDNGVGFDPRDAERIFEMFERLHPRSRFPGTGIGLALCRKIVERHGGRIWAEARPGEGAVFHFDFELAEEGRPQSAPVRSGSGSSQPSK